MFNDSTRDTGATPCNYSAHRSRATIQHTRPVQLFGTHVTLSHWSSALHSSHENTSTFPAINHPKLRDHNTPRYSTIRERYQRRIRSEEQGRAPRNK